MEDVLSRISSDPVLREAVIAQLGLSSVTSEEEARTHVTKIDTSATSSQGVVSSQLAASRQSVVYTRPVSTISTTSVTENQSVSNSPLAAWVHQVGASSMFDPLAVRVHQSEIHDAMNPNGGHQLESDEQGLSDFDPDQYSDDDEFTFAAQPAVTSYIEKHFRKMVEGKSRKRMYREHSILNTPAAKAPMVDEFIMKYLKGNFP